jgi:putative peptide zinc metalloprotease protein
MSDSSPAQALAEDRHVIGTESAPWPRLLPGTEPIGQAAGSGLREPPYLVRRCDGQVVQVSQLLYVIASQMDGRDLAAIAGGAGVRLDVRITPAQVAYVAEQKLAPLGLVTHRDGSAPSLEPRTALLALRFRTGIISERAVNVLAGLLRPLFLPPIVIATLAALAACDVWLATTHRLGGGVQALIHSPSLVLAFYAVLYLSIAFHECGHATACRYGGARPGRIGAGFYLVWPAFYTDVTDSYRLSKAGRLRTDLGGVYFNAIFAVIGMAAYFATGYAPLLIVVVFQQVVIVEQFIPWLRLDGYHVVSDLIGVSDLFARIKPVVAGMVPGRRPHPSVTELKPWARAAVTTWVLTTVSVLSTGIVLMIIHVSGYFRGVWQSLQVQLHLIGYGTRIGSVVDVLAGAISAFLLLLPVAGMVLMYMLVCRGLGTWLALRRARAGDTHAKGRGTNQPPAHQIAARGGDDPGSAPRQRHDAYRRTSSRYRHAYYYFEPTTSDEEDAVLTARSTTDAACLPPAAEEEAA